MERCKEMLFYGFTTKLASILNILIIQTLTDLYK